MSADTLVRDSARAIDALAPALAGLEASAPSREELDAAVARGHFTPDEDDRLRSWFARYLTARSGLLETVDDLRSAAGGPEERLHDGSRFRCFVLGYTAACVLVRAGRFLVEDFATHKIIRRKLNESAVHLRIPRKQYTAIYRTLTRPINAYRLSEALHFAAEHRAAIDALADDPVLAPVVLHLRDSERALRVGVRRYLRARLRYRWHSWRRRRATALQKGLFAVCEGFGRVIADVRNPWHRDRLTARVRAQLSDVLQPGDVLVARHDHAFSNLFLPGYWPHAALYIGPPSIRGTMPIELAPLRASRWAEPLRVLEARKDGVRFRALADTLAVDAVAVIRPVLSPAEVARAISRGAAHEGKPYNFDFDFFCTDRLVCTEVVYRAYEGIGGIQFTLSERGGRPTLSAEDLLDMAVDGRGFEAVAVWGAPGCRRRLVTGAKAQRALVRSYRRKKPPGSAASP